jgi:hypothetical protein
MVVSKQAQNVTLVENTMLQRKVFPIQGGDYKQRRENPLRNQGKASRNVFINITEYRL